MIGEGTVRGGSQIFILLASSFPELERVLPCKFVLPLPPSLLFSSLIPFPSLPFLSVFFPFSLSFQPLHTVVELLYARSSTGAPRFIQFCQLCEIGTIIINLIQRRELRQKGVQ